MAFRITKISEVVMFLFGTKKLLCPYCMAEIRYNKTISNCPNCKKSLPNFYVQKFDQAAPVFFPIIGWTGVGKTVYIHSLLSVLNGLSKYWEKFYLQPCNEEALSSLKNTEYLFNTGNMPMATPIEVQQPNILIMNEMLRWGSRSLVISDNSGEIFNRLEFEISYFPYLFASPLTMMMVDLDQADRNPYDLFSSFNITLQRHQNKTINRQVTVILSKADLYFNQLPFELKNYLVEDPFKSIQNRSNSNNLSEIIMSNEFMESYMVNLRRIGQMTEDWFINYLPNGVSIINMSKALGINLNFSLVSSLGSSPTENQLMIKPSPTRVLDPLFIALDFYSK